MFTTPMKLALMMFAFLVIAGSAQLCLSQQTAPDADKVETHDETLQRLLQERVETAHQYQESMLEAYMVGRAPLQTLISAQQAYGEARYETTQDATERLQILESLIEMAQKLEKRVKVLYDEQRDGGEPDKLAAAQLHRLNAQIRLVRFKKANNLD